MARRPLAELAVHGTDPIHRARASGSGTRSRATPIALDALQTRSLPGDPRIREHGRADARPRLPGERQGRVHQSPEAKLPARGAGPSRRALAAGRRIPTPAFAAS